MKKWLLIGLFLCGDSGRCLGIKESLPLWSLLSSQGFKGTEKKKKIEQVGMSTGNKWYVEQ